jgi:hypothetical protein
MGAKFCNDECKSLEMDGNSKLVEMVAKLGKDG